MYNGNSGVVAGKRRSLDLFFSCVWASGSLMVLVNVSITVMPPSASYLNQGPTWGQTNLKMKLFLVLATLFAAVQAQFSIGAPAAGATLHAGQNVDVQIIVPIDTVSYMLRCGWVCHLRLSRAQKQGKWKSASSSASSPVDHLPALHHQPTWVKFCS